MTLSANGDGRNIVMKCDLCGLRTRSLRRVNGSWRNPKTGKTVMVGAAWVCPRCLAKMGGGK